jgi:sugar phosphate isomerase/epimerase
MGSSSAGIISAVNRRAFLSGLAVAAATRRRASAAERLPIAFSTLGCPAWSLARVLETAVTLGYAAIELRGLEGEIDLTKRPELQGARIAETRARFAEKGLAISDLGAGARMHEAEPAARAAQLDEGRRYIDLAHALGTPYVRVFPDKLVAGEPREATIARIVDGLRTLGEHAKGSGVAVLLESHGDFTRSPDLKAIMTGAGMPSVAFLWDAHHTFVSGGESPAATWAELRPFVRHTHLKDSRREGDGVRYVLTGEGSVPVRETVRVLVAGGYQGYYCYEWEKKWHPAIEEPEVAFPHFAKVMAGYLAEAKVSQATKRHLGPLDGRFRIPGDFNEPLPEEVLRAFEGV